MIAAEEEEAAEAAAAASNGASPTAEEVRPCECHHLSYGRSSWGDDRSRSALRHYVRSAKTRQQMPYRTFACRSTATRLPSLRLGTVQSSTRYLPTTDHGAIRQQETTPSFGSVPVTSLSPFAIAVAAPVEAAQRKLSGGPPVRIAEATP